MGIIFRENNNLPPPTHFKSIPLSLRCKKKKKSYFTTVNQRIFSLQRPTVLALLQITSDLKMSLPLYCLSVSI